MFVLVATDIKVRRIRNIDLDGLRALHDADRFQLNFERHQRGEGVALVAIDSARGKPIGCGFVQWPAKLVNGGYENWREEALLNLNSPLIRDLEVHERYRGCDVGSRLEATLRGVAFTKGFSRVHVGVDYKNAQRPDVDGSRVLSFYLEKAMA